MIKTIRISAEHAGPSNEAWQTKRKNIITILNGLGYAVIDGSAGYDIALSGARGVQTHIKRSDAYLFFGQLTIGEMLKACSIFVGLQTLDPDLKLHGEDGVDYMKQLILYGSSSSSGHFFNQLEILKKYGTISQEITGPERLIRRPKDVDDLVRELQEFVPMSVSTHGLGTNTSTEWDKFTCGDHVFNESPRPEYTVCVFTSARRQQDEKSEKEAYSLGEQLAKNNWGLITGLGNVGLMLKVHEGAVNNGGMAYGANCPHIIRLEGMPAGFSEAWVTPDIYDRMAVMLQNAQAVIVSGGGRGGAGTFQEALACILLMSRGSRLMLSKDKQSFKPLLIDNRLDYWHPLIAIAKEYGLKEGVHFHVVNGTDDAISMLNKLHDGKIKLASSTEDKIQIPLSLVAVENAPVA